MSEITQWRRERLGDGALFLGNDDFSGLVERCLGEPDDREQLERLGVWLRQVREASRYERVFLLDARARPVASYPETPEQRVAPPLREAIAVVLGSREVTFLDLHRDPDDGPVHLSVLVPIHSEREPLGVLVLRVDPTVHLYPIIQRWPAACGRWCC